jgi:hypothetical protein
VGSHPRRAIRALSTLLGAVALVCVDPRAASAAANPLHELAARYAPVVRLSEEQEPCASGEAFEPIDVNAIFGNDGVALRGPWNGSNLVMVGPQASDVASGRHGYSLDFPGDPLSSSACSYEEWQRRITTGRRPTVYAHLALEDGKLALQYWFFYVYKDFNNKHEGDWELIQLDFDASTPAAALHKHPFEVGYSQHEGAERAEWGSPKLELERRTHPTVYPAEGSHANYFSATLFLGRSAAQGIGCDNTNEPWRQLTPVVDVIPRSPQAASAAFPVARLPGTLGRAAGDETHHDSGHEVVDMYLADVRASPTAAPRHARIETRPCEGEDEREQHQERRLPAPAVDVRLVPG